jgi:hypothetical protein
MLLNPLCANPFPVLTDISSYWIIVGNLKNMSLEAKFASLKIDDAASVVAAVKKDGVKKSGLAANISVLAARCESSDDVEILAAMATVKALAEGAPEAQAFTKECLGVCK